MYQKCITSALFWFFTLEPFDGLHTGFQNPQIYSTLLVKNGVEVISIKAISWFLISMDSG